MGNSQAQYSGGKKRHGGGRAKDGSGLRAGRQPPLSLSTTSSHQIDLSRPLGAVKSVANTLSDHLLLANTSNVSTVWKSIFVDLSPVGEDLSPFSILRLGCAVRARRGREQRWWWATIYWLARESKASVGH